MNKFNSNDVKNPTWKGKLMEKIKQVNNILKIKLMKVLEKYSKLKSSSFALNVYKDYLKTIKYVYIESKFK